MKHLVLLANSTDDTVYFMNTESERDNLALKPLHAATEIRFDIPDNSDSDKYFSEHHMEIRNSKEEPLYSIWCDDNNNYALMYCKGREWSDSDKVPGYSDGGNGISIGLVLNADSSLSAVVV